MFSLRFVAEWDLFTLRKYALVATYVHARTIFNAQKPIHFPSNGGIRTFRIMYEHVVRRFDFSACLCAEFSHGGGQGERPDGRTNRHTVISAQIHRKRLNGHRPSVHGKPPAPPKAQRALRPFGGFDFINVCADTVRPFVCLLFHISHSGEKHHQMLVIPSDIRIIGNIYSEIFLFSEYP